MEHVKRGREWAFRFVRQQDAERSKPYTSCRIVVAEMQLILAGLEFDDDTWFVETVRKATGVAEVTADGQSQGTSAADLIYGLGKVLPWVEVDFVNIPWSVLFDTLRNHEASYSIAIAYATPRGAWILPPELRRSSPTFRGKHQFLLRDARVHEGRKQVRWVNCLDPRGTTGQWLDLDDVRGYAVKSKAGTAGVAYVTVVGRSAGMRDAILLEQVYAVPATVKVPKGSEVFVFDPTRNTLIREKTTQQASTAKGDCTVRARKIPAGSPSGVFVRITSGGLSGKYVRLSAVNVDPGDPSECGPLIEAATAPLKAEIAERDRYIEAVRAIPVPD